ncbi:MAG: response regulator [Gammaproteobacteria bacterium]
MHSPIKPCSSKRCAWSKPTRNCARSRPLAQRFVANMSHELRTPLNSIIGFSNILLKNRNQTLAEKDLDHAEKINRNGKHLLNLINDILDLSKIESGRMEVEVRPTRVDGLAREVVDMLKPQAEARNINLEFTSESTLHTLYTDTDKLKQVLINLIGNAIKFTHEGGVRVRVLQEDPQSLSIAVSDSGIGIPPQQLEAIFEPFRQVDSSTTRKYGGTGLGLTISRSIIHMLNGEITVKSELGKGSTFSVRLPLTADKATPISAAAQPPAAVAAQPPAVPAAPVPIETPPLIPKGKGPRRVLIVDDDADARELLSGYITEIGALPILAADGEQALRLAREHHPDLITLDLMMPGIDGWEVLKRLKVDAELQAIPVVIISIVAERRKAVVLGAIDAITKPIVHDDLIAILRRTLHAPPHGRVLVVDDNPEVLDLFRHLLADEVAEIRTAYNGKDALDVLRDYRPDLIFLDLMMPEMDGLTFLRVLRTDKQLMSLPVIIVTAKELTSSERKELEMRVVDIIQKGDESLEDRLREVLEKAMEHA